MRVRFGEESARFESFGGQWGDGSGGLLFGFVSSPLGMNEVRYCFLARRHGVFFKPLSYGEGNGWENTITWHCVIDSFAHDIYIYFHIPRPQKAILG